MFSKEADMEIYLIRINTHWKTPAIPVHEEGPVSTNASCIKSPTEAANETKDTTYAIKSQSFNLLKVTNKKQSSIMMCLLQKQKGW